MNINTSNLQSDAIEQYVDVVANHIEQGKSFEHDGDNLKLVDSSLLKKAFNFIPFISHESEIPKTEVLEDLRVVLLCADENGLSEAKKEKLDIIRGFCDRIIANNGNPEILRRMPKYVLTGLLGSMLKAKDLAALSQTSKTMHTNTKFTLDRVAMNKIMFGASKWNALYGLEVKDVPKVPQNILERIEALKAENKLETHKLILMPAGLSLNQMEELAKTAKGGHQTKYTYLWKKIRDTHGSTPLPNSHWILMQTTVLEESRGGKRAEQIALAQNEGEGYDAPTLLEAVALNFVTFAETGERLFSDHPLRYTICNEEPIQDLKLAVGSFSPAGLSITRSGGTVLVGVAPVLR